MKCGWFSRLCDTSLNKDRDDRIEYVTGYIGSSRAYKNDVDRQKAINDELHKYRRIDKLEGKHIFNGLSPAKGGCYKLELAYR